MPQELYFEDFYPGQIFNSLGSYRVTAKEIISFGEKYDPQPFHLDEAAGEGSFFKGLAASGWLTAAIVMAKAAASASCTPPTTSGWWWQDAAWKMRGPWSTPPPFGS